ncbi:MAG: LytR C-terminal domain-containing protein [Actinomycetota bacterium]
MAARMGNGRPGSAAAGRGLLLVLVALVIGVLLLGQVDDAGDGEEVAAAGEGDVTETTGGDAAEGDATDGGETTDVTSAPSIDPETGETLPEGETVVTDPPVTELPVSPEVRPAPEVTVVVVNGNTGVNGAAGRLSDQILPFGYAQVDPTNATDAVGQVATSLIHYEAGFAAEANKLAGELGWVIESVQPMPEPPPVEALNGANLLVLLGTDNATAG